MDRRRGGRKERGVLRGETTRQRRKEMESRQVTCTESGLRRQRERRVSR